MRSPFPRREKSKLYPLPVQPFKSAHFRHPSGDPRPQRPGGVVPMFMYNRVGEKHTLKGLFAWIESTVTLFTRACLLLQIEREEIER